VKVTHDLLACQKGIVTDIVDRDLYADRCPDTVGISQFASHAPALRLETRYWFAEQRLLGRVDDPGTIAIVGDTEILIAFVVGNRTSNTLGARVASDNANALSIRFQDLLNGASIVELKEVAVVPTSLRTRDDHQIELDHRVTLLTRFKLRGLDLYLVFAVGHFVITRRVCSLELLIKR
jgi:hypothetical protein